MCWITSGAEVTSVSAAALGFTYTVLADNTGSDVDSVLAIPGTHILIQIPGGQPSGVYSIKAEAANVNTDSGVIAAYYPSSKVRAAIVQRRFSNGGLEWQSC